jgi:hypothetical protein
MISETCIDSFPYVAGTDYIPVSYNDIKRRTVEIFREPKDKYKEFGKRMFDRATKEFRFSDNVKKFVASL